ncbi:[FeFe] hydrogenase H-cluster radical SAM maturase HydE [Marispirochaeta aestuarii]|uniref:[FeFe] hydrogenase H-cluster radical SAM maturase HydE n=1 Tax=Marispirochaeta aestuarii TaxID=1963862 RepID=A0A1Y1RTU5_9SPIO|nr:[FeFe] hydrogenase H-cluster radical SAM maturase HydE [Marispirochaeta aestuarii]ORC31181.1 [FeFe] hydrogenase H-cluster radical SAM maturase HydE [Marispirochaeta aestuarii]
MSDISRWEELFLQGRLDELSAAAMDLTRTHFGDSVFLRGLLEYSNHCSSNCLYCGIRRDNSRVERYRLDDRMIYAAVDSGFSRGLRTFVLQGGEDPEFGTDRMCRIVREIKKRTGGMAAVTLSCGILSREDYAALKSAGADRYLLRFETSDPELHRNLRDGVSLERRLKALDDLRNLGFQTGSGFMVGLPGEDDELVLRNIRLARELELDMIGIGPFIPHPQTPLAESPQVPLEKTLLATAMLRITCPKAHIPATTAAGSLEPDGRERMLRCGANVLMPNISPVEVKPHYMLYPGKICLDEDGLHCIGCLAGRVALVGRKLDFDRADGRVIHERAGAKESASV